MPITIKLNRISKGSCKSAAILAAEAITNTRQASNTNFDLNGLARNASEISPTEIAPAPTR